MLIQFPKSVSNYVQFLLSFVHRSKTNHPIYTYTLAQLTLKVRVLYEASKILRHSNQTRSWNIEFDTKSNRVKFDIRDLKWNSSGNIHAKPAIASKCLVILFPEPSFSVLRRNTSLKFSSFPLFAPSKIYAND